MPIFKDNKDRLRFLSILEETTDRFNWVCYGYCLMDNHYHLLVETVDPTLSNGMRHLNGVYTQSFNRRHGRGGHIFQGRFKSILVDRDSYLKELCRYIVLNPVRAGLVKNVSSYRWSSYKPTVGLTKVPPFLNVSWLLSQFGKDLSEAQKQYRKFVLTGIYADSPWHNLKASIFLGPQEFIQKLTPAIKNRSGVKEIPKEQRLADRPDLEVLFPYNRAINKSERNEIIRKAYFKHGYTITEIALHLNLHYATVGRVIK